MLTGHTPTLHDYFGWDVDTWSQAFPLWQKAVHKLGSGLKCLELGAREGGLSLWLASQGHGVVCSDLESPENRASPLHKKFGVSHLISYEAIDATDIPYENQFDVIVLKSILGIIGHPDSFERQKQAVLSAHRALRPGGVLLYAENLKASHLHRVSRKLFTPWSYYWRYLSVNEMRVLMSPFRENELHTTGVLAVFGRSEKSRQFLHHTDKLFFNRKGLRPLHYMGYGVAIK